MQTAILDSTKMRQIDSSKVRTAETLQGSILDKTKIKQVTDASKTATATMIMLGFRQRAHSFTTLESVKSQLRKLGERVVGRDFMDFWRGLEEAGVGSVVLGRRGGQTRFAWNYSLRQIAQIAIEGKSDEIKKIAVKKERVVENPFLQSLKTIPVSGKKESGKGKSEIGEFIDYKELNGNKKPITIYKEERTFYAIPVRAGFTLEVSLPNDISNKELDAIGSSFKSLAGKTK